jgi:hypothetical protein|tara:strand:- start:1705 stop:2001 length:297 start_codon:yes stop_codon:yes gene_type:complete
MTFIEQVANKLSEEEKIEIKQAVKSNDKAAADNMYDKSALPFLFRKWKEYIPKVNQNIECVSCRKTVSKFWKDVVAHIDKNTITTRTGALAKDAGSSI